jgi:phosphatidylserine decarboxylase
LRHGWPVTGSALRPGGGQLPLHPVLAEFQALIDSDPVVRMYLSEMIAQVPRGAQYRKRHLESVQQMLLLVNEVLTMAPEYSSPGFGGCSGG